MKAPISWLKDFVDIDVTPEVLASKLVSPVSKLKKSYITARIFPA